MLFRSILCCMFLPCASSSVSVVSLDYDYSKAYGGGGDASLSSAGGTFGSNAKNWLAAGGLATTLGALDDGASSDGSVYYDLEGKEEVVHIFVPPGKLGVVIDTPDDGFPVVHAVKDNSVIANRIMVGDKLVAVDDEDVRPMTAINVSKMITRKSANPARKLTVIRASGGEEQPNLLTL